MTAGKQGHHCEKLSNYAQAVKFGGACKGMKPGSQIPFTRLTSSFPGSAEAPVQPFSLEHLKKSIEQRISILLTRFCHLFTAFLYQVTTILSY